MVEKCNDTIKSNTVEEMVYESEEEMEQGLLRFMLFYILYRRHGGIVKETWRKTPYDALILLLWRSSWII